MDMTYTGDLGLGIVTNNLEPMMAFYHETLGCQKVVDFAVPFGHIYKLMLGPCSLKLVTPNAPATQAPVTELVATSGIRYLTLECRNLRSFYEDMQSKQVDILVPMVEMLPKLWVTMIRDPDGNVLEFIERITD